MSTINVDPDADRLLRESGFLWNDFLYAFQRIRRTRREATDSYLSNPVLVTFEELNDHHLIAPVELQHVQPTVQQRRDGLAWLASRIRSYNDA